MNEEKIRRFFCELFDYREGPSIEQTSYPVDPTLEIEWQHTPLEFEHLKKIEAFFGTDKIDISSRSESWRYSSWTYGSDEYVVLRIYGVKLDD